MKIPTRQASAWPAWAAPANLPATRALKIVPPRPPCVRPGARRRLHRTAQGTLRPACLPGRHRRRRSRRAARYGRRFPHRWCRLRRIRQQLRVAGQRGHMGLPRGGASEMELQRDELGTARQRGIHGGSGRRHSLVAARRRRARYRFAGRSAEAVILRGPRQSRAGRRVAPGALRAGSKGGGTRRPASLGCSSYRTVEPR